MAENCFNCTIKFKWWFWCYLAYIYADHLIFKSEFDIEEFDKKLESAMIVTLNNVNLR